MGLIDDLKNDTSIDRTTIGTHSYAIRVLGRGDMLFFQEDENALVCQIDASNAAIFSSSVNSWNNKASMSSDEKERVLSLIVVLYKKYIDKNVVIL